MKLLDIFRNRSHPLTILLAGLGIGSVGFYIFYRATKPILHSVCVKILEDDQEGYDRGSRVITVEAEPVKVGSMAKQISTTGKLRANAFVEIKSEIDAKISEICFTEGTTVKKGQPVIKFDSSEQKAALERATAGYVAAASEFKRNQKLLQQRAGSQKDYDKTYGEFLQAKAQVAEAKARLEKHTILAPFDGSIGLIDVSPGAFVERSKKLVTIVDMTPMKIDFKVPAKYVRDIGVGQAVDFQFDNRMFRAVVEAIDSNIDVESHSLAVRASVANEDGYLTPGNFVSLKVITAERGDVVRVPESSIDRQGEIEVVWVVEKGKASLRRVITGGREDGYVEIVGGLEPGQTVVTAGQIKLSEGIPVKIAKPEIENIQKSSK